MRPSLMGARRNQRRAGGRPPVRHVWAAAVLLAYLPWVAACGSPTVWKTQSPSPDGKFIAIASTVQNGGFGNAEIETSVYLRATQYSNPPQLVVGFSCPGPVPHPYTLDNVRNAGGTIGLKVRWVGLRHLEVTYEGSPDLDVQMAQIWGVRITVRRIGPSASGGAGARPVEGGADSPR